MAGRGDIKIQDIQPDLYSDWPVVPFDKSLGEIGSYVKIKSSEYNNDGLYPVIDQGEKYISGYVNDSNLLYKGDLPIIIFGDHTRNIKYVDSDFAVGADGTKILHPIKQFYCKFYYHYLKALTIPNLGYSRHYSILRQINVPLPPLAEQKRIADKLDVLFGQLNIVQKAIERIPELIKNFRQQILSSAVTGKLTEEWRDRENILNEYREFKCSEYREYNFEIPDQWILLSFADVVRIESNLVNPIDYPELPLIAPDNIESMTGRIISKPTVAEINPISPKHLFSGNSLIYSKIRPYLSKIAFVDFKGLCSADMYPLKTSLDIHYLYYYMLSPEFLYYATTAGERIVLPKINRKGLNIIPIPVPSIEEQKEIVRRIDSFFKKLETIEQQYNALKLKIEKLPQALLNKAFSGELVEHLPSDGDAETLLKEIEQLKRTISKK